MTRTARLVAVATLAALAVPRADAQDLTDSHLRAAEALLVQLDMENVLATSLDMMLETQIQQNPNLEPFEDIMRSFLGEHLSWDALGADMARLYAEAFTEAELGELAAFYETAVGRKAIVLMPSLMTKGMELGQRAVQEHLPELERRIEQRALRLGQQ